ncbi:beta-mannosidase-like isoform X2 [Periplaneta americana]|uniref:beta-mannosidase-like isoform X2 n=1 Tax=Periplaneta americana TaxID=6978 RepID=UPI0037E7690B
MISTFQFKWIFLMISTMMAGILLLTSAIVTFTTFIDATLLLDSSALDGTWTVRNANGTIKAAAVVPGGIYTDLRTAGILSQDIYYRFNDIEYRWVSMDNWTYSTNFQVAPELIKKQQIFLVFHGVDTVASVYLNDKHIGDCGNMFVRYSFPIKSVIQSGENHLEVRFQSAITAAQARSEEQAKNYVVPPNCVPKEYRGECHVNFLRKMQASFAWDWGPAFPSAGLWKSVVLEAFDTAVIRDVTTNAKETKDHWILDVKIFFETGREVSEVSGKFEVSLQLDTQLLITTKAVTMTPDVPGEFNATVQMEVAKEDVELWWPNEFGAQKLYNLSVSFNDSFGKEVSQTSLKVGFRTIELVQEPVKKGTGLTFYFKVNNVSIFSKGSNWIPSHVLPEKSADPVTIHHLLSSSKKAHMNMLRVWGGGLYESDLFYQLADEMGILIWQDFMFACALYPTNPEFLRSVKTEVKQQVRRLQHHPSIALWAGNNENEAALRGNWYGTSGSKYSLYKADYIKLYVDTIRPLVQAEDSRPYVVSSPSNGLESEQEGYIADNPYSSLYGDTHYYNYLANGWQPAIYPETRFASEYGFQSLPSFKTLSAVSELSDWSMTSNFSDHRQHHPGGNYEMQIEMLQTLPVPADITSPEEYQTFIYFSQIYQAMAIKTETENYRRWRSTLISNGQGLTMGALYWQLNDIWQAPSWASIEFGGKWKMLHYFACNFFAPVLVSPCMTISGELEVHLISDLLQDMETVLTISVYSWDSLTPIYKISSNHILHNASVTKVVDTYLVDFVHSVGCKGNVFQSCFFYFTLQTRSGQDISPHNFLLLSSLAEIVGFRRANITVDAVTPGAEAKVFEVKIKTDAVALFVWLEAYNIEGHFSDNGFLMVTSSRKVQFNAKQNITSDQLKQAVTIISLADIH